MVLLLTSWSLSSAPPRFPATVDALCMHGIYPDIQPLELPEAIARESMFMRHHWVPITELLGKPQSRKRIVNLESKAECLSNNQSEGI